MQRRRRYRWACDDVYRIQSNWASIWDTLQDYVIDTYGGGRVAPTCPKGYAPQYMSDPYSGFAFYAGSCINICRQSLFYAGLLTTDGNGAAALAASAAGRAAIGAGAASAGVTFVCQ